MSESKKNSLFDAVKHVLSLRDYYLTYDVNMLSIREKNENLINITKAKYYVGHIKKQIAKDTNGQFLAKYIKCINVILKNDLKSGDTKTGWKMTRALNMLQLTNPAYVTLLDREKNQLGHSTVDDFKLNLESMPFNQDKDSFILKAHNEIIALKNNVDRYGDLTRSYIYTSVNSEESLSKREINQPLISTAKTNNNRPGWFTVAAGMLVTAAAAAAAAVGIGFFQSNAGTNDQIKNIEKETDNAAEVQRASAQRKQLVKEVNAGRTDVRVLQDTAQGLLRLDVAATTFNRGTPANQAVNPNTLRLMRESVKNLTERDYCPVSTRVTASEGTTIENVTAVTNAIAAPTFSVDKAAASENLPLLERNQKRVTASVLFETCQQNARS